MAKSAAKPRVKAGTSKVSAEDRRTKFVEAYLSNGGNATDAALQAGYGAGGAAKQGYRMSKDPVIVSMLESRRAKLCTSLEISTERILLERARLAFFDVRKLFDSHGAPVPIHELDDDAAAAIAGLEVVEQFEGSGEDRKFVGYLKKYKLADKGASLTSLEKQLGMYEKDNAQKTDPLIELLRGFGNSAFGVVKKVERE